MKKYLLRYFIFWLPAVLVAYFYNNAGMLSQTLQWVCAILMIVGWSVNTGFAAYYYPMTTLSILLFYSGVSVIVITAQYMTQYGSIAHTLLHQWGGIISYKPLDILVMAILDFNIPHEIYVVGALIALCAVGLAAGLIQRRIHPNPYHPKIMRSR